MTDLIMRRELKIKIAVCLFTIVGLVAAAEARKVRIGIGAHSVNQTAFYVAKEKGYYQKEDLEVELVLMRAPVANMSLIAGEVEFTSVPTAALTAALRGAPLRVLFSTYYRPLFWLYANPGIREIEKLRGKKIGSSGTSADLTLLKEVLNKYGLEGGRDVPILSMGDSASRLVALISGSIDATVLVLPWNLKAKEAGYHELVSFIAQDLVLLAGSIVVRERLLRTDLPLIERFVRGTLKGFLYARDNRSGTVPILARYIKIKEDLAAKSYDLAKPAMTDDGTVNKESQQKAVDLIKKTHGEKESSSLQSFFDFSVAKKMGSQLEASKWIPED